MQLSSSSSQLETGPYHALTRVSFVLSWLCAGLAILLPLAVAVQTALWKYSSVPISAAVPRSLFAPSTPLGIQASAGLMLLLPVGALSFALWRARQCFQYFTSGVFFVPAAVKALRGFAAGMVVSQFLGMAVQPLIGLLMMWAHCPKGEVVFNLSSHQLLFILFAGMVWTIAGVMARGVALAEENAQFV